MLMSAGPLSSTYAQEAGLHCSFPLRDIDDMNERIREIAEECSRSGGGVDELSLFYLRPYLESFLDLDWLDAKLHEYETWASTNSDPTLQRNILHQPLGMNVLVAMIWSARSWERLRRDDASFRPPGGAKKLINIAASLAVLELQAGEHLDLGAREHIRQRLQAADEFYGMAHEICTFAYFVRKGADVEPRFLRKASPQELVVHWEGHSIPVQCKSKKPGSGRRISQDDFTTLAGSIARDAKLSGRPLLVRIGSTGPIRQQDIGFLRSQVARGVASDLGLALVAHDGRVFTLKSKPLSGRFTIDSARDYLSRFEFHVGMVIGEPEPDGAGYEVAVVVGIDANPRESVQRFRSLRESVERGATQLRGGPPGIVAVHYADPIRDFEDLRPGSKPMLAEMAALMERHQHVKAVIVSSEPDLQLPQSMGPGKVKAYVKESWSAADLLGEPL